MQGEIEKHMHIANENKCNKQNSKDISYRLNLIWMPIWNFSSVLPEILLSLQESLLVHGLLRYSLAHYAYKCDPSYEKKRRGKRRSKIDRNQFYLCQENSLRAHCFSQVSLGEQTTKWLKRYLQQNQSLIITPSPQVSQ